MRHVCQSPLYVRGLDLAHENPPQDNKQATRRWTSFGHKPEVITRLLRQQYQLCCYSELRSDQAGLEYHIEHVENKSQAPLRTFDETNLAASALSTEKLPNLIAQDVFGGHAAGKQRSVEMDRFIHCHQPDSARFFAYLSDGRVVPTHGLSPIDADKAQYTIDLLNLNSNYLVNLRQQRWDELEQLDEEHQQKDWDLNQLLQLELTPTTRNQLESFFSLTRQFFGSASETVLQNDALEQ